MIVRKIPLSVIPCGPVRLNMDNPMLKGIGGLFDAVNGIELVYGNKASNLTTSKTPGRAGVGADYSSTANQQYAHRPGYAITGEITIFALIELRARTNYGAIVAKQGTTTTNAPCELRLGASGATTGEIQLLRANASTYNTAKAGSTGQNLVSLGALTTLVVRSDSPSAGAQVDFFVNGVKYSSTMNLASVTDNGSAVWIGRRYDGVTQFDGRIYHVGLMQRMWMDSEVLAYIGNPLLVYAP